jgi:heat shock protein HslJ
MKKLIPVLFVLFLLTACRGGSSASVVGTWKLVSYGPADKQTPAAEGVDTSIEFKDGKLNGNVGCNSFGGDYKVNGDQLTFGPIMSTMMACLNQSGDQEQGILAVLKDTVKYSVSGDTLTITSADKAEIVLARK